MKTRDKLAAELRKVAGIASYENAQKYEGFAKRAETGEFDDFGDKHDCPITQLYMELTEAGLSKFAKRVADGEFDATPEESEAWAGSPEGQATMRAVMGEVNKPPHTGGLGDAPVQPQFAQQMQDVASAIDLLFNGPVPKEQKKVGFILMTFEFDNNGRCNYMSNASREDVVVMLKQQIARFEGQADITGQA